MSKRKLFFGICLSLFLSAGTATADLFNVTVSQLNTVYTSGTGAFTASKTGTSFGQVTGKAAPADGDIASFVWFSGDSGDFSISMTLSGIGASTADGTGSFTFTDASGTADTITGDIAGTWSRVGTENHFSGLLSNVLFNDNSGDGEFNGGATLGGSVDMGFSAPTPWRGSVVQITSTTNWFGAGDFDVTGGSVDAVVVPVPGAVLLGMLGLGAVGIKLRKFA